MGEIAVSLDLHDVLFRHFDDRDLPWLERVILEVFSLILVDKQDRFSSRRRQLRTVESLDG